MVASRIFKIGNSKITTVCKICFLSPCNQKNIWGIFFRRACRVITCSRRNIRTVAQKIRVPQVFRRNFGIHFYTFFPRLFVIIIIIGAAIAIVRVIRRWHHNHTYSFAIRGFRRYLDQIFFILGKKYIFIKINRSKSRIFSRSVGAELSFLFVQDFSFARSASFTNFDVILHIIGRGEKHCAFKEMIFSRFEGSCYRLFCDVFAGLRHCNPLINRQRCVIGVYGVTHCVKFRIVKGKSCAGHSGTERFIFVRNISVSAIPDFYVAQKFFAPIVSHYKCAFQGFAVLVLCLKYIIVVPTHQCFGVVCAKLCGIPFSGRKKIIGVSRIMKNLHCSVFPYQFF